MGIVTLIGLAVLLAWLPLRQALLLVGAGATGVLLLWRPWLIWLAVGALLPFAASVKVGPAAASDLLLAAAVGLWFLDGARRRTLPLRITPLLAAALVYVAVLILSAWGAANFAEAGREVLKWLEFCAVLVVASAMIAPAQRLWVAAAVVLGAVAQAALGLYQFWFAVGPDFFTVLGRFMRAYGSFAQPNPFGGYMGLVLPVTLSLALWAWAELARRGRVWQSVLWALYFTGATGIIAAALLASWSRGSWLGAVAGVLVVLVLRSRRAAVLSAMAALGLGVALLLGAFTPQAIPAPIMARVQEVPAYFGLGDVLSQPVTDDNFAVIERLAHWVAAQRMWEQAPWLGVGPGNYATVYPSVRLLRWEEPLGHAHNIYLNVLGETGLVGLAAFLALLVVAGGSTWRSVRRAARRRDAAGRVQAALAIGVLGMLAHLCVHNLVDNLFVQGMVVLVGLWLALAQDVPEPLSTGALN